MSASFAEIRGLLDAPVVRPAEGWRCVEDTPVTRGPNTLLLWPTELTVCPELQHTEPLSLPGIRLATLVLEGGERLFLPRQRGSQFRAQFVTRAGWAHIESEPQDGWLPSNQVRWDQRWHSRLHHSPASFVVVNRRPQAIDLRLTCNHPGVTLNPNQATVHSLQSLSVRVECHEAAPGATEILVEGNGLRQVLPLTIQPELRPARPLLQVSPRNFRLEPGQEQALTVDISSQERGLLRLDTHPRPRLHRFEPGQVGQSIHTLTLDDLPPMRKGRMRISLFLDHPWLNVQATHCWVDFQRPVLERQFARLHLSPTTPQAEVAFWRSDGAPVELEASTPNPELATRVQGTVVAIQLHGKASGQGSVTVRDRLSGLWAELPVLFPSHCAPPA